VCTSIRGAREQGREDEPFTFRHMNKMDSIASSVSIRLMVVYGVGREVAGQG
jgi:hypothetical protein